MSKTRNSLIFFVNDKKFELDNIEPDLTLVSFLRRRGLTGAKIGCLEGVCGSCTVVVGKWDTEKKKAHYAAVNACLVPLFWLDLCFVLTVEGIGNPEKMHPIQERLSRGHGSQCGYCSPGFVMAMYALLRNTPHPTEEEIKQTLKGNLCRCTGYRPILEAFNTFSSKNANLCGGCPGPKNGKCCQENSAPLVKDGFTDVYEEGLTKWKNFPKYDPTQELIFPPELIKIIGSLENEKIVTMKSKNLTVICPKTLKAVKEILNGLSSQDSKVYHVSSGLDLRLRLSNSSSTEPSTWIAYNNCEEMKRHSCDENEILIGAALPLTEVRNILANYSKKEKILNEVIWLQDQYSHPSVRNVATWSGSLLSAHGDFPSLALALNLKVYLYNFDTEESSIIRVDENFFTTGKKAITGNTIITHGVIDLSEIKSIRSAKFEPELHHLVNLVQVQYNDDQTRIALNGFKTEPKQPLLFKNVKFEDLEAELKKKDVPEEKLEAIPSLINLAKQDKNLSEESHFETLQLFQPSDDHKNNNGAVGRPLAHQYADQHTTGDAKYVGDMKIADILQMALVLSTEAHAEIVKIDASEALKLEGVIAYIDARDIPEKGTNLPGQHPMHCPNDDTPVFADKKVLCVGQTVGAIVAETIEIARKAAKLVKVEYKPLKPITTIEEAIKQKSYFSAEPMVFKQGENPDKHFKECAHVVEGDVFLPGQQHCYMEPQSAIVIPQENGEW
jgi:xanthine dehydrogenase iron-sulfur cluster and FAD-binding subunit A